MESKGSGEARQGEANQLPMKSKSLVKESRGETIAEANQGKTRQVARQSKAKKVICRGN
jgi:hypothetical protein